MKRGIILILMLILTSTLALALNVEIDAVENHVLKGQNAKFLVTIDNDGFGGKLFTIKSIDMNWMLENSPIVDKIGGKDIESFELTFVPLEDLEPKIYGVSLIITSDTGDRVERYISVNLLENEDVLDSEINGVIDPRKPATLNFKVNNKYEISFTKLDIKLTSSFFNKEFNFPLDRKEEHIEDFVLELDPNLESGSHPVRVLIKYGNIVLTDKEISVEVGDYSDLNEIIDVKETLLTKKEIIRKINNGNSVVEEKYTREFSLSERMFTLMTPRPDEVVKVDGYYTLNWNLMVEPGEEVNIVLNKNYRDPFIIIAIVVLIGYFIFRWKVKTVRVKKKVMTIHTSEKKYISNMKVLISVKNRGGKVVKKLKVRERIPNLNKTPKSFGSLKPSSVRKVGNDLELIWDIGKLQIGEERLLTYRVESKLHILGKLVLPPTVVKYEEKNKSDMSHSNKVSISLKKVDE